MKKLLLLVALLTGCATTRNYERNLASWIGHNSNDLVSSWGYPTRTFNAPNGNTVYAYERALSGVTPVYTTPASTVTNVVGNNAFSQTAGGQTWGGLSYTSWCNTYFEVDKSETIIFWRWQGNACAN